MDNGLIPVPGELVMAGGTRYHVRRWGKDGGPTMILEAGLTMLSSCWGWLAPELAKMGRVIAYDRAGLGWSEERDGLREARRIGEELCRLVEILEITEKVIIVGHSMGAMFNQAFLRLKPGLASKVVWLDPAHPDQLLKSRRMQTFFFLLEFADFMASRNLPSITLGVVPHLKGLPERDYQAVRFFLKNSRHLKITAREARAWPRSVDYVRDFRLGATPLLIVSAQKNALRNWGAYQKELAGLSSHSQHVTLTDVSHLSMLGHHDHALRVVAQIREFIGSG